MDDGIDNFKAELRNKYLSLDSVVLELKRARSRDLLVIKKDAITKVYLDFPSTLLSLIDYIDYKIISKNDTSMNEVKAALGQKLVIEFYTKLGELLKDKNIHKNVKFCDFNFKLFK